MSLFLNRKTIVFYKNHPDKFDFDKGKQLGNTDAMCGIETVFDKTHSQSFRDGYCQRFAECKVENMFDEFTDPTSDAFKAALESEYDKIKQFMENTAKVKYNDAPKVSNTDFDELEKFIGDDLWIGDSLIVKGKEHDKRSV